jgi:nucleoside-diphosphate-sugar epimerase
MGVEQIQGDLADERSVFKAAEDMDTVFHVAAKPGQWGAYEDFYKTNVVGTRNVVNGCIKNRVQRLIHTSSPSVISNGKDMENVDETVPYPDTYLGAYPETKALAEKEVLKAVDKGLAAIIIRPRLIWGPEDNHLFPRIISRARRLKIIGKKADLTDTIYIDNAADAHMLAAVKLTENPSLSGNIYFVSQDDPVSKWELLNSFLAIAGHPPLEKQVSAKTAYLAGALFEFAFKLLGIKKEPPITRWSVSELATSNWYNITKAKEELGYKPNISIEEGLERLRTWYNNQDN